MNPKCLWHAALLLFVSCLTPTAWSAEHEDAASPSAKRPTKSASGENDGKKELLCRSEDGKYEVRLTGTDKSRAEVRVDGKKPAGGTGELSCQRIANKRQQLDKNATHYCPPEKFEGERYNVTIFPKSVGLSKITVTASSARLDDLGQLSCGE